MRIYQKPYRIKRLQPTRRFLLRQRRYRHLRSILKSRFFWVSIFVLIIFGAIFYFFLFSDFFQIKEIIINRVSIYGNEGEEEDEVLFATGQEKISQANLKLAVESELGGKMLFFKKTSIFLVNLNKIRENILKKFPQIEEIEISRGFPDALNLAVIERKGIGIFCQDIICFLLDREGVIFEIAPNESPLLKFQNASLPKELNLGEKAIEKEILTSILEIDSKLREDLKIPLKEVSIISGERIDAKTGEGWEIYFNPKEDLDWQMAKLAAVLEKKIPLEKRKNLKYIDLRFEKVYLFPETYSQ